MPFFAIFITIPLIELLIFAFISDNIGFLDALVLSLLTAIIGGAIVQHQGLQTMLAIKSAFNQGKIPLNELFDGLCLVAAGALLITPGFMTDVIGFSLVIPYVRRALRYVIKNHTRFGIENFDSHHEQTHSYSNHTSHSQKTNNDIIAGHCEDITPESDKKH